MDINLILSILIFDVILLLIVFITKSGLFTITPEKQWSKEINDFDKKFKDLEKLDITDYKTNSGHIY